MQKHPRLTLDRVKRLIDELAGLVWIEQVPLQVEVLSSIEPITYAAATSGAYTPVELPYAWGPRWSTLWLRLRGEWPAQWAGSRVAALIDTGSEALVWDPTYAGPEGSPAQGLDANRQDFVLYAEAPAQSDAAARQVTLFVEAAGNDSFGCGEGFTVKRAALARRDDARWELWHDLRVLHNLALTLDETAPRRAVLIRALNDAANAYRELHGGKPAAEAIAAARAILAQAYAPPAQPSASSICALGHSHIDTAWLWPIRETIRKCSRTFSTVLKYIEDYPEYRYVQSQPQLYAYVKEHYPALYARIRQAIMDGAWEPQGAMWVEADCNVPSGESFVRQMLYGTHFFKEEFGCEQQVLWLPDVFGYSAALPQIIAQCGMRYFMTQKISWNQTNKFPHHTFWWEGIDGTRVLAHFPPADTYCGDMTPAEVLKGERQFQEHGRAPGWLYLFGFGDGGGGVTREMLESARRMQDTEGLPRIEQRFAGEWFEAMEAQCTDLCTWAGELYLEYHRGTLTTQAHNKRGNRRGELLLRDAELLSALRAALDTTAQYPQPELEQAWKLVLLNQFHDILPGSSIGWVYEDSARDYAAIDTAGQWLRGDALRGMCGNEQGSGAVTVWNTLSFPRDEVIALPQECRATAAGTAQAGSEFGTVVQLCRSGAVPSIGFAVIDAAGPQEAAGAEAVQVEPLALENGLLRAEFNALGELVRLYDKQARREVLKPGYLGNELQLFDDRPVNWDAWDIDPYYADVRLPLGAQASISVLEQGPLRGALRVERTLSAKSTLVQEIRLCAGSRRLDFATHIDWHEEHALLKVAFPVEIHSPHATYEIQFGHVERPVHANTSWDWARFETPLQRWVDLSETGYGAALLNDCKYGCDVLGQVLRLSLLRAPKSPDPNADMGAHSFTYSLYPHLGDHVVGGVLQAAAALNSPLLAVLGQPGGGVQAQSYFALDAPGLVLDTLKRAEDGQGLIVRLYEALRSRGTARLQTCLPLTRAVRCDLLERPLEELALDAGVVELSFRPFEIITLRLS